MSVALDEAAAWRLVRRVRGAVDGGGHVPERVTDPVSGAWLTVDRGGRWTASTPPDPTARDLFELYLPLQSRPAWVLGQLGQSVDGRIATVSGASHYVTGDADLDRLHRVRALADAVVVGASTVEHDDPRLTVRRVEGDDPVRVVLDPRARLDPAHRVFTDGAATTLVVRCGGSSAEGAGAAEPLVVEPTASGALDLTGLLGALRARGLRRILVEGGGVTVSGFLQAGLLDRLHVTVAPLLIGSGRPSLTLDPVQRLDQALRPPCRHHRLGEDVLFDFDLREPAP